MPQFNAQDVDVDAERAMALIDGGDVQIVDVREQHELDTGGLPGARHIELVELPASAETLDRGRPVLFYCRSGSRSGMAANAFRRAGYDAYSMDGGIAEWQARGLPLEPPEGEVADH